MSSYPTLEELLNSPDLDDIMRVKRSFLSILSLCAKFFLSLAVVVLINSAFDGAIRFSYIWQGLPDISLRWLGLVPLVLLLNVYREYHDDIYIFGLHGVTKHQGRLSLNKSVPHVKYADILSLRVHQDPWGRILNYGDVDLDTASAAGVELVIEGVSSPDDLAQLVNRLRFNSAKTGMTEKEQSGQTVTDLLESEAK